MKFPIEITAERLRDYIERANIGDWGTWCDSSETGKKDDLSDLDMVVYEHDPDDKSGTHRLDVEAVTRGISVLATTYPHHLRDLLADTGDMWTGNLFIQCCIFGEEKYC